jgi:hypothetical protein
MSIINIREDGSGVAVDLPNGYQISIIWREGSYSDLNVGGRVETAIINPAGDFVEYEGDDVQGYQSIVDVLTTIAYAETL